MEKSYFYLWFQRFRSMVNQIHYLCSETKQNNIGVEVSRSIEKGTDRNKQTEARTKDRICQSMLCPYWTASCIRSYFPKFQRPLKRASHQHMTFGEMYGPNHNMQLLAHRGSSLSYSTSGIQSVAQEFLNSWHFYNCNKVQVQSLLWHSKKIINLKLQ